jgi:hypothetical protein
MDPDSATMSSAGRARARAYRGRLAAATRASPALVTTSLTLIVACWWAARADGGIAPDLWPAGGIFVLLLGLSLAVARGTTRFTVSMLVSAALLASFAVWSYLSIIWAAVPADALEGANKTIVYAFAFLLAGWAGWTAGSLLVTLTAYGAVVAAIGSFELVAAAGSDHPGAYFIGGRLAAPMGYTNANAALFLIAVWPLLIGVARRTAPPVARGAAAVVATILLDLALLTQSRASVPTTVVTVIFVFALAPGRLRLLAFSVAPVACVAVAARWLLPVYRGFNGHQIGSISVLLDHAVTATFASAVVAGVATTGIAVVDRRMTLGFRTTRVLAAAVSAAVVVGMGVGAAVAYHVDAPTKVATWWRQFKTNQVPTTGSSHLLVGLGSDRYDFWRVATRTFLDHPIVGVGADNYATFYLQSRRSYEEPRYPHSLELRTAEETGAVGVLLLAGAIGLAGAVALRRGGRTDAEQCVAVGAVAMTVDWVVHGSVDWLWEFPGLSVPALAALAAAGRIGPRLTLVQSRVATTTAAGATVVIAVAGAIALGGPWIAARDITNAQQTWGRDPAGAFDELRTAARLNPLSDEPSLTAGVIHGRRHEWRAMRSSLTAAARRNPLNWYTHLELAVADIKLGRVASARRQLARARDLNPREPAIEVVEHATANPRAFDPSVVDQIFVERIGAITSPLS